MKDPVLVTSGDNRGSRAALAAVRALAAGGYRAAVTVSGGRSLAGASRFCARRVEVPSVGDDPTGFAAAVRHELASGSYLTVLPITEAVLMALDLPIRPLISKVATAAAAARAGIPIPPSRIFASAQDLRDAADGLAYPIVIKPDIKTRLAMRADDAASVLLADLAEGILVTQPFLDESLRGVLGLMWQGKLVSAVHMTYERIWPIPCGTVTAGRTLPPDVDLESGLERLLANYNGIFHVDLAGPYLLDLNPRVHAAVTLGVAAGVNVVAQYCDLLRGTQVTPVRAKPGIRYRWLEADVRSLIHAGRRGDTDWSSVLKELAPHPRTAYSIEDIRDPWPSLERLLQIGARVTKSLSRPGRQPRHQGTKGRSAAPIGPGHAG